VSLADRALGRVAVGGSAGLGASLAASPLAAVLAGVIEVAPQAVFDARPLALASLREFLARGAMGGRASAGHAPGEEDGSGATREALLDRLAGRAPGSVWLALPGAGRAAGAAGDPWSRDARLPRSRGVFVAGAGSPIDGGVTPYGVAAARTAEYGAAGSGGAASAAGRARHLAADAGAAALADAEAAARDLARAASGREATDRAARRRVSAGGPGVSAWSGSAADLAAWSPWAAADPVGAGARRPGQIAVRAESFSHARSLAAADLSLDFLSPELLAAARAAGVGPIAAGRAQRIAASGRPHLAALAAAVDRVFVEALSPGSGEASSSGRSRRTSAVGDLGAAAGWPGAGRRASGAAAGPSGAIERMSAAEAAAPGRASPDDPAVLARALGMDAGGARVGSAAWWAAISLGRVAPVRAPRGAFLLPDQAARFLGVRAGAAEEMRPNISAALELVAASEVAEAATGQHGGRPWQAAPTAGALGSGDAAASRATAESARAQLPRELWSVFDAVYLSLDDGGGARPLAPSARAARALAVASRSTSGSPGAAASARARAAAAWAVLPVVLPGGATRRAGAGGAGARVGKAAGGLASGSTEARARGAGSAGQALASLVAPTFLAADRAGDAEPAWSSVAPSSAGREQPGRAAPQPTFVSTSAPREAPSASPAAPPPPARPSEPPKASPEADMAWFYEAAQKYFADAGPSSSGLSVAEMTLVTAAPRAQVAASPQRADRPVTQAASTTQGDASKPGEAPAAARPDVDKIAQEVFEQVCRMIAIARERSGDPWHR
jgi:hypothetical protein